MSNLDALYAAILANPEDMTLWLVYANALDEDDEAFGWFTEMIRSSAKGNRTGTFLSLCRMYPSVESAAEWREVVKNDMISS